MPSLIKFLVFCGVLVGLAYAGAYALVIYVEPEPREKQIQVPADRLKIN